MPRRWASSVAGEGLALAEGLQLQVAAGFAEVGAVAPAGVEMFHGEHLRQSSVVVICAISARS